MRFKKIIIGCLCSGNVLHFRGMFVAAMFKCYKSMQHPVGDTCSLSLALAGIPLLAAPSRVVNIKCFIIMILDQGDPDSIQSSKIMTPRN